MVNGKNSIRPVEVWGGIECTVNRVKDEYLDQVIRSGHEGRPDDLERIAATGIRTLRYPVLWERTAPQSLSSPDWRWPDQQLARLRELGITPIRGPGAPRERAPLRLHRTPLLRGRAGHVRRHGGPALPLGGILHAGE
jgi:hypothetical protein